MEKIEIQKKTKNTAETVVELLAIYDLVKGLTIDQVAGACEIQFSIKSLEE